ncbi:ABC transporter permease [Demequina zhanjiangensis]|uniref:FtsX-like permease family protein n=1 Tax=Demequina zhanjiangensis TaxID=3051659 RepID=A0ABT8FXD6_9MICO|nr:FtsX-like permease family protein [Demequina sp. SYSU T00b26]MDN4471462.1 FtsX-like permease family protein [Demequina sp. SYSU T00b26]
MFRLAYKSVKHNPKRLLLTAVAVALGVALVSATLTLTNALSSGFNSLFSEIYGGTDVIVEQVAEEQADGTGSGNEMFAAGESTFDAQDLAAIQAVDGVSGAYGGLQVTATVLAAGFEPTGDLMSSGGPPTQMFNWTGEPDVDRATLIDGAGPAADGEIVLDVDSAPSLGYEIGDSVTVATVDGVTELTLVGTVRFGESNSLQGAVLAYVTESEAHALTGEDGYQQISVLTEDGADNEAVATAINEVLPDGTRAITGEAKAAEQAAELDDILQYIDIFAIAFALIALFVGSYIIVNTFRIIVTQRTREFGLMRAIGVTGRQLRSMILLEAVVIAIVASTIGIIVGYLGALGMSALVEAFSGDLFGTVTLPPDALLWSYALGSLVTLVSALLPAIHASSISPMEALRESATESKKPLKMRNVVGGAITLLGLVGIFVGLYTGVADPYWYVGAGAMALIIGVTLLAAQVLVPLAFGLRDVLTRMFKIDGKLAANNIRREPRRSANTAAALMIGVMLLALVATFTESLKTVVTSQFTQINAELFVLDTQTGVVPQGAMDIITSADGVDYVSSLSINSVEFEGMPESLVAVEAETADAAYDYDNEPDFTELDGGVFIGPDIQDRGVEVGDQVTLTGDADTLTLEVTGLYNTAEDGSFWVEWSTAEQMYEEVGVVQGLVVLDEDADVDEVQADILEQLSAEYPLVALQQPDQLAALANTFIDLILGVISALLGAALIIAILGVANTLLLSVTERTREIGLLRAVGVRKSSIWRMITIESMVMAVFGTVLGMILGVGLGAALVRALEEFGFTTIAIPWIWLIIYTVGAAIAGVVAAIWPAWRASRMDILKAIATDG